MKMVLLKKEGMLKWSHLVAMAEWYEVPQPINNKRRHLLISGMKSCGRQVKDAVILAESPARKFVFACTKILSMTPT